MNPDPALPPGEVHSGEVFLHRSGLQERDVGRHPPGRVPPDRGGGGRLRADAGRPHGRPAPVLHQTRSASRDGWKVWFWIGFLDSQTSGLSFRNH